VFCSSAIHSRPSIANRHARWIGPLTAQRAAHEIEWADRFWPGRKIKLRHFLFHEIFFTGRSHYLGQSFYGLSFHSGCAENCFFLSTNYVDRPRAKPCSLGQYMCMILWDRIRNIIRHRLDNVIYILLFCLIIKKYDSFNYV
jgi:hypothetical protein